ncbi:3'(2'),5'-bisphosphate nucleotidase [Batrachochytrium dendrobatidis]|nr:3'(2'),5'-bisphosphate nucleotidase [Batrachochytrium dendrobatidis]
MWSRFVVTRQFLYQSKAISNYYLMSTRSVTVSLYAKEREVGIDAVLRASRLCQTVFKHIVSSQSIMKADKSPVTIADYGAQAVVNSLLKKAFPNDLIVGEEDAADLNTNDTLSTQVVDLANSVLPNPLSTQEILTAIDLGKSLGCKQGRFWTLDPIDGTKGFLRGDQYAVCLALIVDGVVQVAVQGCPNLPHSISDPFGSRGSLFVAVRGQGAFERLMDSNLEHQIRVLQEDDPAGTQFCESFEAAHSSQSDTAQIGQKLNISKPSVRMDSQCKYAVLARGDAGIYLRIPARADYVEKIWDHAGGSLLVEEAGGRVSDVSGKPLDFTKGRTLSGNKGIVATNGLIHKKVLDAVQSVLKL